VSAGITFTESTEFVHNVPQVQATVPNQDFALLVKETKQAKTLYASVGPACIELMDYAVNAQQD